MNAIKVFCGWHPAAYWVCSVVDAAAVDATGVVRARRRHSGGWDARVGALRQPRREPGKYDHIVGQGPATDVRLEKGRYY